jgi:hypothetical protein
MPDEKFYPVRKNRGAYRRGVKEENPEKTMGDLTIKLKDLFLTIPVSFSVL